MDKSIKICSVSDFKKAFRQLYDLFAEWIVSGENEINHYLKLEKIKKIRSVKQNRLYWWWIAFISIHTGQDKNDLHNVFSELFLQVEIKEVLNFKLIKNVSTSDLTTIQFNEYLEKIRLYMIEFDSNIVLLYPDDVGFEEFVEFIKIKGNLTKIN